MHIYECWHYLCRETLITIFAASAFLAQQEMAAMLGVSVRDIVVQQLDEEN